MKAIRSTARNPLRADLQRKSHAARRVFADIRADTYVLTDGDDIDDPITAPGMLRILLQDALDMVTGALLAEIEPVGCPDYGLGNRMVWVGDCRSPGSDGSAS